MSKTRAEYKNAVNILVKDQMSVLDEDDVNFSLDSACDTYSRHKSKSVRVDVTATGSRLYSLPSNWEAGFSERGYQIEYPVDDTQSNPVFLTDGMTEIVDSIVSGNQVQQLRFIATRHSDILPQNGETFRVYVPTRYVLTEDSVTIPDSDFLPVCKLAASDLLKVMSVRMGQNSNGMTDIVDFQSKADKMQSLAKVYHADYMAAILPPPEETKSAGMFGEFKEDPYDSAAPDYYPRTEEGRKFALGGWS